MEAMPPDGAIDITTRIKAQSTAMSFRYNLGMSLTTFR